jgi:hypothetical protein
MSTYDAYGERGYTSTTVIPDEHTEIRAVPLSNTQATIYIGSVSIHVTQAVCDELHEAITQAYELIAQHAIDAGVLA